MKKIFILFVASLALLTSCSQDKLNDKSIFEDVADTTGCNKEFEEWLYINYVKPYNAVVQYQLPDGSTEMDYNLVPVSLTAAKKTAYAVKYLWMDVYKTKVDCTFVQSYTPRLFNLIGSPAIDAAQGTMTLGVAEGGVKITLYYMNYIDYTDMAWMNTYIFHVMHHEFSHILHQAKTFPSDYDQISAGNYDSEGWQYHTDEEAYSLGFVTPYSMKEAHEDFVEVISSYITDTRETWEARGFIMKEDHTGIEDIKTDMYPQGTPIINQKITMAKDWLREKFGYELDSIRAEVQRRQDALAENPDTIYHYCKVPVLK